MVVLVVVLVLVSMAPFLHRGHIEVAVINSPQLYLGAHRWVWVWEKGGLSQSACFG